MGVVILVLVAGVFGPVFWGITGWSNPARVDLVLVLSLFTMSLVYDLGVFFNDGGLLAAGAAVWCALWGLVCLQSWKARSRAQHAY